MTPAKYILAGQGQPPLLTGTTFLAGMWFAVVSAKTVYQMGQRRIYGQKGEVNQEINSNPRPANK